MARNITPDSTVYSAAAWWSDNDPFAGVVATTKKKAERAMKKLIWVEAQSIRDNSDEPVTLKSLYADIGWSGVHAWALKDIVSGRNLTEAVRDLNDSGVYYSEV